MRERITFVQSPGSDFDPTELTLHAHGLGGPPVVAVREDRVTFPLDEIPSEAADVLRKKLESFHLRWVSPLQYDTWDPFSPRVSPGLHVSFTASESSGVDTEAICSALQAFGPLDCRSQEAFTRSKRHAKDASSSFYFYQQLEDLKDLAHSNSGKYISGIDDVFLMSASGAQSASSLDISYVPDSQQLKITALWPLREHHIEIPASELRRTEVGLLTRDTPPNMGPNDIGMAGVLMVMGESKSPSPTRFAFPSRHRLTDAKFTSSFTKPTGLHPSLRLELSSNQPPTTEGQCSSYAYLTLPKPIFSDRYQLGDQLFLASKNLSAAVHTTLPVDLEAPAYITKAWGSAILLKMAPPLSKEPQSWTAEVPLHLRYLEPSTQSETVIEIPYPAVFWACEPDVPLSDSRNPFDQSDFGYDDLFDADTVFWHINPESASGRIMNSITVPVLPADAGNFIGLGTVAVVILGFLWVIRKLYLSYLSGSGHALEAKAKKDR